MTKQWHDMTELEYLQSHVTSYTGGATWIKTPWNVFFVAVGAPVEIRRALEASKDATVRVEVLYP